VARLELIEVEKSYGGTRVLRPITLDVESGELLVLLGPSGCGKSTLLRIVAGLVPASAGELRLDGRRIDDLEPRERDVAMVFQNYALYPHMTVERNLAFPLVTAGVAKREVARRTAETARMLGLGDLLARKPGQLSGGQMQRVALGRALIREPRLFLFDEPLSNLDAKLRDELRHEIGELHRKLGITTLYVTHDQVEAMTLGHRVAVLERGRLHQVAPPAQVFSEPATTFVAGFLGSPPMNLIRGWVVEGALDLAGSRVEGVPVESGEVVLGVRPHEVELRAPVDGALQGVVASAERLGHQTVVRLRLGEHELVASRPGLLAVAAGERVGVGLPRESLRWFDVSDGKALKRG
jgi:ABC-type sugar transport system ATPase subunit